MPTLLRLAILIYKQTGEPLDILLTYCHLNLQNSTLTEYLTHFGERAHIKQLAAASPLNMRLLTPTGPPAWHPSPHELRQRVRKADDVCVLQGWKAGLPDVALGFAYRKAKELDIPTVVGLSTPAEVHETVHVWRELNSPKALETVKQREAIEKVAMDQLGEYIGWSWASPPDTFKYSSKE